MTNQKLSRLAQQEEEISKKVIVLSKRSESEDLAREYLGVFTKYRGIHGAYTNGACENLEALKRGLFIQWFALSKPNYLTGIAVDLSNENRIIECLHRSIGSRRVDDELRWMLNYYFMWKWIFERLDNFEGFGSEIINDAYSLPERIDREEMAKRGQMGEYWNSLALFSK